VLRAVSPDATREEVAAIVAAITACSVTVETEVEPGLDEWVRQSRLRARRIGRVRGPWRMSGRVARRERP
jgi:hypothetical protein